MVTSTFYHFLKNDLFGMYSPALWLTFHYQFLEDLSAAATSIGGNWLFPQSRDTINLIDSQKLRGLHTASEFILPIKDLE
jgi:hypothetical protein